MNSDVFKEAQKYSNDDKTRICFILNVLVFDPRQSKEIIFQLQEDLMKLLNELYTVSLHELTAE